MEYKAYNCFTKKREESMNKTQEQLIRDYQVTGRETFLDRARKMQIPLEELETERGISSMIELLESCELPSDAELELAKPF